MIFISSAILFLFLIIGSAYSTDDFNNYGNETVLESAQDTILETEPDTVLESSHDSILKDNDAEYECHVDDAIIDDTSDFIYMQFRASYNQTGNITVMIDDELCYNHPLEDILLDSDEFNYDRTPITYEYFSSIGENSLNKTLTFGNHSILVKHIWDNGERTLINDTFNVTYRFYAWCNHISYGDEGDVDIYLPKDATGTLTVTYNGKTKKASYNKRGYGKLVISTNEFKIGDTPIIVKLTGDKKYPDLSTTINCTVVPNMGLEYADFVVSAGENEYFTVNVPKGMSGTFKLYNTIKKEEYDGYWGEYFDVYYKGNKLISSAKVKNGIGRISTSKFAVGEHHFYLVFKSGKYEYECYFKLAVVKNNPKIKISFSTKSIYEGGKTKATIKFSGKKQLNMLYMIDGKINYGNIDLSKGKASKVFSKLKVGTHKIRFYMYDEFNKVYYSKVFKITVKPKISITAKNIAFKKSSKKFTLKSTLKIKGKLGKYKKISFKLNNKTYKVKTNKKGIAKKTLKKSVLNSIKVGQKIKFQVVYGKKTVNRYITVK